MRPLLLKLDDSLEHQATLGLAVDPLGGRVIDALDLGLELRLWGERRTLLAMEHRLRLDRPIGPDLVFAGSSDFHHLTPMLLRRAIRASGAEAVNLIHLGRAEWPGQRRRQP